MTGRGRALAIRTPQEKLVEAIREFAESETYRGRRVVVSDYAIVLFAEEVDDRGTVTPSYLHLTSHRSSWHALRGLVATLVEHVARNRP